MSSPSISHTITKKHSFLSIVTTDTYNIPQNSPPCTPPSKKQRISPHPSPLRIVHPAPRPIDTPYINSDIISIADSNGTILIPPSENDGESSVTESNGSWPVDDPNPEDSDPDATISLPSSDDEQEADHHEPINPPVRIFHPQKSTKMPSLGTFPPFPLPKLPTTPTSFAPLLPPKSPSFCPPFNPLAHLVAISEIPTPSLPPHLTSPATLTSLAHLLRPAHARLTTVTPATGALMSWLTTRLHYGNLLGTLDASGHRLAASAVSAVCSVHWEALSALSATLDLCQLRPSDFPDPPRPPVWSRAMPPRWSDGGSWKGRLGRAQGVHGYLVRAFKAVGFSGSMFAADIKGQMSHEFLNMVQRVAEEVEEVSGKFAGILTSGSPNRKTLLPTIVPEDFASAGDVLMVGIFQALKDAWKMVEGVSGFMREVGAVEAGERWTELEKAWRVVEREFALGKMKLSE